MAHFPINPNGASSVAAKPPLSKESSAGASGFFALANGNNPATEFSVEFANELLQNLRVVSVDGGINITEPVETALRDAIRAIAKAQVVAGVELQADLLWSGNANAAAVTHTLNTGKAFSDGEFILAKLHGDSSAHIAFDFILNSEWGVGTPYWETLPTSGEFLSLDKRSDTSFRINSKSSGAHMSKLYAIKLGLTA